MSRPASLQRGGGLIWASALSLYLLAVFHRSSLAVAGLAAAERFDITAAQLASFTMLQLLVYAGMQVPVGLLVDRFGPRSVILTGAVLMAVAQVGFALAETFVLALLARTLVGVGDAMTFICLLRLVATWFPPRRIPFLTQLSGTLGQSGALFAAAPMTWALGRHGWTGAYLTSAAFGVVLTLVAVVVLRDGPGSRHHRGATMAWASVRSSLRASWAHPGTRLGFWIHFSTQFSATAFGLLWGYPFLVRGEGRTAAEAGLLLSLLVVAVVVAGPVLGWLVGLHPWHRSSMALVIVGSIVAAWTVVLLWPGDAPTWLLVLLVVVVGIGGPASMIGFDVGRTANPVERLASSSGIINVGGFSASLLLVIAIGLVLDWRTPGSGTDYPPEAFRWAMSTQYVLWAVGLTQLVRYRVRARRVFDREALQAEVRAR